MKRKKENSYASRIAREPIAIVGMSCRFPQSQTLAHFWELLHNGKDTITEIKDQRWDHARYYNPDPAAADKTQQRHASLLENIHDFDPLFFGISPAEAYEMNPSQKLMLELVWEAIENSSISIDRAKGGRTGVYVGNIWTDFEHYRKSKNAAATSHSALGQSANIIANRVSFKYGFTGPSLVVDTGCSSSLVALHLACQALWDDSIGMAVVAGVNHILDPDQYILLSKFGGLSASGKCNTFSHDADGFVRGEGGGVVLLKKLSEAEKNGDKIWALVKGTAMNNNGHNVNLPATSVEGQKSVLADAYKNSGIDPQDVHYVEAHGTGTRLGDPTESLALGQFFGQDRKHDLHIGSVKTNIGHLEAAAGIAGLIKVVLAMQHRTLPPSLNYKKPNPNIPFEKLRLRVQTMPGPWPVKNGETLKAGINSFGWGGTNAHTVVEEYRQPPLVPAPHKKEMYCLAVSAQTDAALREYVKRYAEAVRPASPQQFGEICVASALLKPSLNYRAFFSANTKEGMLKALMDFAPEADSKAVNTPLAGSHKVVMIFPGQGSQWAGMGKDLLASEPVFREVIEACDKAFRPHTDWSLISQLTGPPEESRLNEIDVVQPALCAIQIALAKLWMSWGIQPQALAGHSMGEVAAACISGAIDLDEAALIICTRSRLMKTVSGKGGAMAVTELSLENAEALLLRFPQLSVAASNSPKSTVLAGDQQTITEVLQELEGQGLFCRQVNVDVASHSSQMDPLKKNLRKALKSIRPHASTIPFYSTVKGQQVEGKVLKAGYWVENLRNPVHFSAVVRQLMQQEHTLFIEVSPHPLLVVSVNECAAFDGRKVFSTGSLLRDKPGRESMYKNLGGLFVVGYEIPWKTFYGTDRPPHMPLPAYPFQRERFELKGRAGKATRHEKTDRRSPLLGKLISLAGQENVYFRETVLSLEAYPYLRDHLVNEAVVVPGAVFIEMTLEAAAEIRESGVPVITGLKFMKPVTLTQGEEVVVQLKILRREAMFTVQFYKRIEAEDAEVTWQLLAEGELEIDSSPQDHAAATSATQDGLVLPGQTWYERLKCLGLGYGPYFQGLKELRRGEDPSTVSFSLMANDHVQRSAEQYKMHPAMLDACLQPVFFRMLEEASGGRDHTTFLTGIRELQVAGAYDPSQPARGVVKLSALKRSSRQGFTQVEADITVYCHGQPFLVMKGIQGKAIESRALENGRKKLRNWLYELVWKKLAEIPSSPAAEKPGSWLVLGDGGGTSDRLLERMTERDLRCIHAIPGAAFTKQSPYQYTLDLTNESDYQELLNAVFRSAPAPEGIIHMASLGNAMKQSALTADALEAHQACGSGSLLYLYQQLTALKLAPAPRMIVITSGVQAAHREDEVQPMHSPLRGMAKVMANEATQYATRYFDLSAAPTAEELDQVVTMVQSPLQGEDEIAFRGRSLYVPRLQTKVEEEVLAPPSKQFSSWGTYVVTGFGGIALDFITWMTEHGARHFALVSRTGKVQDDIKARLATLRSKGCSLEVFSADAGRYDELEKVFDSVAKGMPPVAGVVHAAGVIRAGSLADLTLQELIRVLHPKVRGAWNLHLLTRQMPLDCFIMFSSASSLIGLSGQGSYVAANAFLDALAHHRKAMGLPATTVNWGVISDAGMVAHDSELERYARAEGFEPVPMSEALEAFNVVYQKRYTQIGIAPLHPETMAGYYSTLTQRNFFKGLLQKQETGAVQSGANVAAQLASLTRTEEKTALLESLVIRQLAEVIKTPAARINASMTFKALGVDSIMAVQLRNSLEKMLDLKLPVGMFWTHPSIHAYACFLSQSLEEMQATRPPKHEPKLPAVPDWFVIPYRNPAALFRIFLFHDAGGDTCLYSGWEKLLGRAAEVVAVELPGRGKRIGESPYDNLDHLIADLKPALASMIDKPYAFFGHSLGALLAFEMARSLRRTTLNQPSVIFISSAPALTTYPRHHIDYTTLEKDLFKSKSSDSNLRQSLQKLLKDDLHLLKHYRYAPEAPLHIPLVVIYGDADDRVSQAQAERWEMETHADIKVIARPGGHRYIEHDGRFLTDLVRKEMNLPDINETGSLHVQPETVITAGISKGLLI